MHAMTELEALRRKNQEIVNRCDLAVQEADYYRKQHKSVLNKCDQLVREAHALRGILSCLFSFVFRKDFQFHHQLSIGGNSSECYPRSNISFCLVLWTEMLSLCFGFSDE